MAQYLTKQEFLDQTIPGDAFAGLTDQQINDALLWASKIADSYLRKRHTLPLVSFGEDLKSNVGDLAQWRLLSRRGIRPGSGNNELAKDRYDDALAWFVRVSKGDVEIECVDSTPDVDEGGSLADSDLANDWRITTGPRPDALDEDPDDDL